MFCCQTLLAGPFSVAGAPWQVPPPTAPPGFGSFSLVFSVLLCVEVEVVYLLEVSDTHGPGLSHILDSDSSPETEVPLSDSAGSHPHPSAFVETETLTGLDTSHATSQRGCRKASHAGWRWFLVHYKSSQNRCESLS